MRRWAAAAGSFTLDFGDYSDSFYSVQTDEGEAISQTIAGYIDIILQESKSKAEKEHAGTLGTASTHVLQGPQSSRVRGGLRPAPSLRPAGHSPRPALYAQAVHTSVRARQAEPAHLAQSSTFAPAMQTFKVGWVGLGAVKWAPRGHRRAHAGGGAGEHGAARLCAAGGDSHAAASRRARTAHATRGCHPRRPPRSGPGLDASFTAKARGTG